VKCSEVRDATVLTGSMSEERYVEAKEYRQQYVSRHNLKVVPWRKWCSSW